MATQHLIFDLDDTLIHCNRHFVSARQQFIYRMQELFNERQCSADEIDQLQQQLDLAGIERYGLGRVRFPDSLVQTYLLLSSRFGQTADQQTTREIEAIGYGVYQQPPELLPMAKTVLRQLQEQGHELYLYTGGDYEIQTRKILDSGLYVHFEENKRYISEHKNKQVLAEILERRHLDLRSIWMIGNSARSDIKPALEMGLHAIHVPDPGGWVFDQADLTSVQAGKLFVADSIEEVPGIIARHIDECQEDCLG
ncbi:MAG: hypothetical protein JWN30_304 [Bacilli bacterium]|nr:hypothetical protein [Bacilli bacterium]